MAAFVRFCEAETWSGTLSKFLDRALVSCKLQEWTLELRLSSTDDTHPVSVMQHVSIAGPVKQKRGDT